MLSSQPTSRQDWSSFGLQYLMGHPQRLVCSGALPACGGGCPPRTFNCNELNVPSIKFQSKFFCADRWLLRPSCSFFSVANPELISIWIYLERLSSGQYNVAVFETLPIWHMIAVKPFFPKKRWEISHLKMLVSSLVLVFDIIELLVELFQLLNG